MEPTLCERSELNMVPTFPTCIFSVYAITGKPPGVGPCAIVCRGVPPCAVVCKSKQKKSTHMCAVVCNESDTETQSHYDNENQSHYRFPLTTTRGCASAGVYR